MFHILPVLPAKKKGGGVTKSPGRTRQSWRLLLKQSLKTNIIHQGLCDPPGSFTHSPDKSFSSTYWVSGLSDEDAAVNKIDKNPCSYGICVSVKAGR